MAPAGGMRRRIGAILGNRLAAAIVGFALLALATPAWSDASHVRIAVGGPGCLCYLPTILAGQLGLYQKNGIDAELIALKGGSQALTAVLGGSADVVSGYYDHTVNLAAKGKELVAFVVYDRFPGNELVVSPRYADQIRSIADLAGRKVGVSAPGSSTDFFLKFLLRKNGIDPGNVSVVGIGLDAAAVAAMEQGEVEAAIMLDPAVTLLQGRHKDLRILVDTRSAADTEAVFGGSYPAGSLYSTGAWIKEHPGEAEALALSVVETLRWIRAHSAEEIADKMPAELVGQDRALYVSALKNSMPMYSDTGIMDANAPAAVLSVFSQSDPAVAAAHVDLAKTYTNLFVERANAKLGMPKQ